MRKCAPLLAEKETEEFAMQQKSNCVCFSLLTVLLLLSSCQSAPPAREEAPQAQPEAPSQEGVAVAVVEDVVVAEEPLPPDFDGLGLLIAEAQDRRREVAHDKLEELGGDALVLADKSLQNAEAVFNAGPASSTDGEKAGALASAQASLDAYKAVLREHWLGRSGEIRGRAGAARQEALKAKADVAVRDGFAAGEGVFNNGEALFTSEEYKLSVPYYLEAESLFVAAASEAAEKRRLAAAALESADKKIEESEKIAADADIALNGGQI